MGGESHIFCLAAQILCGIETNKQTNKQTNAHTDLVTRRVKNQRLQQRRPAMENLHTQSAGNAGVCNRFRKLHRIALHTKVDLSL